MIRTRSTAGSKAGDGQEKPKRPRLALLIGFALTFSACTTDTQPVQKPTPQTSSTATTPDGDRARAETVARKVLTTWARPDVPYKRWWAELEPLISPEARDSYSHTDPTVIPALQITGNAEEDSEPYDPWVTTFYYPTSEGRFGVDMARSHQDGKWRAYSIVFPGETSQRQ